MLFAPACAGLLHCSCCPMCSVAPSCCHLHCSCCRSAAACESEWWPCSAPSPRAAADAAVSGAVQPCSGAQQPGGGVPCARRIWRSCRSGVAATAAAAAAAARTPAGAAAGVASAAALPGRHPRSSRSGAGCAARLPRGRGSCRRASCNPAVLCQCCTMWRSVAPGVCGSVCSMCPAPHRQRCKSERAGRVGPPTSLCVCQPKGIAKKTSCHGCADGS
jgi:hypothetical protein